MASVFVLPGDEVPAKATTLKLGPGLLKSLDAPSGSTGIVATRAGELHSDAKGVKWWIETNAQRVRFASKSALKLYLIAGVSAVCACGAGGRDRGGGAQSRRGLPSRHCQRTSRLSRRSGIRRRVKA